MSPNATSTNLRYIPTRKGSAFSEAVVADFESSLDRNGFEAAKQTGCPLLWDTLGKLSRPLRYAPGTSRRRTSRAIVGLMGPAERQLFPYLYRYEVFPYIWDCWPSRHNDWESLFTRYGFEHIGLTCRQAAEFWEPRLRTTRVHWTPEAIEHSEYPVGPPLAGRPHVLLEIGRTYQVAHQQAAHALAHLDNAHTHPSQEHQKPYLETRHELVGALHGHRALLCYPGSISHPNGRTRNWQSMTHRYLEAVATKTLVLGHVPAEMELLFGFRPGINATPDELPNIVMQLVAEPEKYQELVDRAYQRLLHVAIWDVRVRDLHALADGAENPETYPAI